jgi:glutaredoxin-like protein
MIMPKILFRTAGKIVFIGCILFAAAAGPWTNPAAAEALPEKDRAKIQAQLKDLTGEVNMIMFTQEMECQYCAQTRELLEALAAMSDRLDLQIFDFVADAEVARTYGIDKIPATVLMAEEDVGIRFYGVPAGYELNALVETIQDLSRRETDLETEALAGLEDLSDEIHIQVFVTPTCPYCPAAVRTAYRFAQEHERIRADGVEAVEFPYLATRYHVRGVPMVVINEQVSFVGARSSAHFAEKILEAAGMEETGEGEER